MNKKSKAGLLTLAITICVLVVVSLSTIKFEVSSYSIANLFFGNKELKSNAKRIDFSDHALLYSPNLGKTFHGFKEQLGFKESQNNYFRVNTFGYLGKYQFGKSTLELIGINDAKHFLNTPALQEKAFIANAQRNKWVLRKDIKRFEGKYVNGIKITESGILAAAHLAGPGSVKKYLRSYGENGFKDAFGTSIRSYMKRFSGYDTSHIEPNRRPKVIVNI